MITIEEEKLIVYELAIQKLSNLLSEAYIF